MPAREILFRRLSLLDQASATLLDIRVCDSSPSFADAFARCRVQLAAAREHLEQARALEV